MGENAVPKWVQDFLYELNFVVPSIPAAMRAPHSRRIVPTDAARPP